MKECNCLMKHPDTCIAGATTLHEVPREENNACVQPDLTIPAYGAVSRKLFHKTHLLHFLIAIKYKSNISTNLLDASFPLPSIFWTQ